MWTKLSHALKSKQAQAESAHSVSSSSAVDQHTQTSEHPEVPAPLSSPSKSGRKGIFKRHRDDGSLRLNSTLNLPNLPKKVKSTLNLHGNSSQLTLSPELLSGSSHDITRRASQDMIHPPRLQSARRSSFNILTRPSVDALRSPPETIRSISRVEDSHCAPEPNRTRNPPSAFDAKSVSFRPILRDHNTPGTGKNVRFFSRDAYGVVSPEYSLEAEYQSVITLPAPAPPEETFLQRLQRSDSASSNASSDVPRFASSSKPNRPTVAEIFSPYASTREDNQSGPGSAPDFTNFFDGLESPAISSLTIGLDPHDSVNNPGSEGCRPDAFTSTPYKDGGKGKGRDRSIDLSTESFAPTTADATDLRAKSQSSKLPSVSHDRSNSFSFGQTVFYSMNHSGSDRSSSSAKPSLISDAGYETGSGTSSIKGRSRAFSDTVFMSMIRSPPKTAEGDANDGPSTAPMGKDGSRAPEPDPFSANATTYYTPQTMIPTTPPDGTLRHTRKASKEESIIFSLQTQLDLQNELCGQFEADLRARDELVEILSKKLAEAEQEDAKTRKIMKSWKKKVVELERTCRFLEDEVEGSRQESMERSIMDEASSEALRMLHRQISGLERSEGKLRKEVKRLEGLAKEKGPETTKLSESLGNQDTETADRMKVEEELRDTVATLEQKCGEQTERHNGAEVTWNAEMADLLGTVEGIKLENARLGSELDDFKKRLEARDDELSTLKVELAESRKHAEKAAQMLEATETGKCAIAMDHDILKLRVVEAEERIVATEAAWTEKVNDLENDVQELWDVKEALEEEREQLKERIHEAEGHVEIVKQKLKLSQDRVVELEQERQYALNNISRLEDNIRRRDVEAVEYSQRSVRREAEAEELREHMSRMKREHSSALEATLQDSACKQADIDVQTRELKDQVEQLRRQIHDLQQESADKEVKIVQITKQHAQDKDDLQGLNIALDSKQQELELLKRRLGVRGTGGTTPAQPGKAAHRRDSSVVATPGIPRPLSFTSESGTDPQRERKPSVDTSTKIPALGRSTRLNTSANPLPMTSKPSRGTTGSMGPPPLKPRASIVGTPTLSSRTLTRSSSTRAVNVTPPGSQSQLKTKVSTGTVNTSPAQHHDEKENADVSSSRRLSGIPTLAQ
ncbi:hypothetical protein B0H10DRAFT_1947664 [Mycena sp. CBHHK59/15]|nr:hypothetical protein B0H10DRAFT_1947664 [Mycena sp. CBHHK59/15]